MHSRIRLGGGDRPGRAVLAWKRPNLQWFTLTLYTRDVSWSRDVQVAVSAEQGDWQPLATEVIDAVLSADGWYQVKLRERTAVSRRRRITCAHRHDTTLAANYQFGY